MMRLQRVGRKNDPSFRIVVVDKRTGPKSNKNIAILGSYNPKLNNVQVDADKAKEWLSKGVQPTDTVHNILVAQKVIEGKKVNVLPKKSPIVSESAEPEAPATEASATEEESAADSSEKTSEEVSSETEAPAEDSGDANQAPETEAPAEEVKDEAPAEEPKAEAKEETPAESDTASEDPVSDKEGETEAKDEEGPTEEETTEEKKA